MRVTVMNLPPMIHLIKEHNKKKLHLNINERVKETERGETVGGYRENEKGRVRGKNGE